VADIEATVSEYSGWAIVSAVDRRQMPLDQGLHSPFGVPAKADALLA
jgi:hypothetical protein